MNRCSGKDSSYRSGQALTVALVGMPNTGKSTLYNRLTGGHAEIANWPGLTVELLRGAMPPDPQGRDYDLVDLPGIHDLTGSSEDEAIVKRFLETSPPDLVLVVLNASQISSQLRLLLQLQQRGLPLVAALNMSDEAERFGIRIDSDGLARSLGLPVLAISAKRHRGLQALRQAIQQQAGQPPAPASDLPPDAVLEELLQRHVHLPKSLANRRTRQADRLLLHPLVGLGLFLAIVLAVFQALYALGTPLQDLLSALLDGIQHTILEPGLRMIGLPDSLRHFLVDGVWMGVGTVTTFLPIIFLFYLTIAIVEDSGYLPRAAFLMDGFMHWLGLDGRSFVLQVMGFGCNVPSIVGTRVIRDRGMRMLAMLCIPFALCQARLTVFLFMAAVFFPRPWWAAGLVVFGFYLMSFMAVIITGLIFKRVFPSQEAFVLELPPYRTPSLSTILRRAWRAMLHFLVTTRVFIVVGASAIWLLTHLPATSAGSAGPTIADAIGRLFQPLLGPIGMNPDLTVSLFFGFLAKEILLGAMAVIYKTTESQLGSVVQAAITPLQSLSFMTFVLLYTPCLGTIAAQIQEARSRRLALLSLSWSMLLAWSMALLVYQGGRLVLHLA